MKPPVNSVEEETFASAQPREDATARTLRGLLRLLFLIGAVGAGSDLLLIGHVEGSAQRIPLVLLAGGLGISVWLPISRHRTPVRVFQTVMLAFCMGGLVGLWLHYRANVEFARELTPDRGGLDLFWTAVQGASPPSLAPATLIHLGLLGLASTYRHPTLVSNTTLTRDSGEAP